MRFWAVAAALTGFTVAVFAIGAPQVAGATTGTTSQKLKLAPGPDSSPVCFSNPCATVTSSSDGHAQIAFSLGIESSGQYQAQTYYTGLMRIVNPSSFNVTITSVSILGLSETRSGDIGGLSVYFCAHQTNEPEGACEGTYTATSAQGGTVFHGNEVIQPGGVRFIELSGFAGQGAHVGDTISLSIEVTAS